MAWHPLALKIVGHAVHDATARRLTKLYKGRFVYNRSGTYDFFDNWTARYVQLTTMTEFRRKTRMGLIHFLSPRDLRPVDVGEGTPPTSRRVTEWEPSSRFDLSEGEDVLFEGAELREVDFQAAAFGLFRASRFVRCRFNEISASTGVLGEYQARQTVYVECDFTGAELRNVMPGQARFERCKLQGTDLDGWWCSEAEFVECEFEGLVENVTFFGRPETNDVLNPHRSVNEFRGNDFRRAKLESVAFRAGIRLTDQLLPTGGDFVLLTNAQRRFAAARRAIKRWPSEERDEGLLLLDYLDDGMEEQDQILIDVEDFDDIASEEVAQRVMGLLDPRGD